MNVIIIIGLKIGYKARRIESTTVMVLLESIPVNSRNVEKQYGATKNTIGQAACNSKKRNI
ncbi:unnamed protein product [Haemonchus placei]|uniref:Transposase n=1 Tax=Haemonchus placei TaxID=6290 RepID=A0A0N4WVN2_HAEPC|nr:unnamed protein product [Haemonchus placei]